MPITQLDLGRALDVQTPLATIAALSRQRTAQDQESQLNAAHLQQIAMQIQESKRKLDDEKAITDIIKAGGTPEEVSRNLLKAGYPDQSRTYLTNSHADVLQQQQQALLKIQNETGKQTAPQQVGDPGMQTPPSVIPDGGTVAPVQSPIPAGYMGAERNTPVTVPYVGQSPSVITPPNAAEVMRAKVLADQVKSNMEQRRVIAEAAAKVQAERAGKADVKLDETYQDKPDGRHRMIRMQRPDNSQYTVDSGVVAAAPQNPEAPRSPERMKQDIALKNAGEENAVTLTPAGLDAAALAFAKTGQLPPMGMGKAGVGVRSRIINRAAELNPNLDTTANKADFKANQASLDQATKLKDALTSFENTALKNMTILESNAKKVIDSGSPLLNKPLRAIDEKALGNTDLPVYRAARQIVVNEVAKLTNNPNLSGQLSDSARHEIETLIPEDMTLAQLLNLLPTLKQDMKNRTSSIDEQIGAIRQRIKGGTDNTAKATHRYNPSTGKIEEIK